MTRADITKELYMVSCEWHVPVEHIMGNRSKRWRSAVVLAARATFMRRMLAAGAPTWAVGQVIKMPQTSVCDWYARIRKAEREWFGLQ